MKKPLAIIAALAISSTVITGWRIGPNKKAQLLAWLNQL